MNKTTPAFNTLVNDNDDYYDNDDDDDDVTEH